MHGRIKVKTTAEQEEQKRKEREKKLKAFRHASSIVLDKIEKKEYDEAGLEVTGQLLSRNSDFSSMWNYRKRAFNAIQDKSEEERGKMCMQELEFVATCLRNNPKSYGCWHHRCFIMLTMPEPDWKKELDLCNQFLQFDDRNFHCWDYRRFVVKNSIPEIPIDDEIKCTNKLIESNFSNYSSWHYRSKLLPIPYPSLKTYEQIEEQKLLEELEYVQNAFFTDPNDQSAWFYNQWLLGRGEKGQMLLSVHVCRSSMSLKCIFRKPICQKDLASKASVMISEVTQDGVWEPLISDNVKYQHGWVFKLSNEFGDKDVRLLIKFLGKETEINLSSDKVEEFVFVFSPKDEFHQELSDGKHMLLKSELSSCVELNDLEPGNKWIVLTLVQLMYVIDAERYKNEIEKYLQDLQEIDPMRNNYYLDLRSKIIMERKIGKMSVVENSVPLSDFGFTRLYHLQYFSTVKFLNISTNRLKNLSGPFHLLICCEEILADNNQICDVSGIRNVPKLTKLSLKGNCINSATSLMTLSSCGTLSSLDLSANDLGNGIDEVKKLFPNLEIVF